jgi:mono/diheme cytochrome c family protein
MRFLAGVLTAFAVSALVIFLVIISGAYNVAATVPHSALERVILNSAMVYSVRVHAGKESREAWSEEQVRDGFKEYDAMCTVCHGAPGKERSDISKGLRPEPPNLAEVSKEWTNAQLFWIIKNGIKMTGMPAFGPTHKDEMIWNIVGFVRRLPQTSAQEYKAMEEQFGISPEYGHH